MNAGKDGQVWSIAANILGRYRKVMTDIAVQVMALLVNNAANLFPENI